MLLRDGYSSWLHYSTPMPQAQGLPGLRGLGGLWHNVEKFQSWKVISWKVEVELGNLEWIVDSYWRRLNLLRPQLMAYCKHSSHQMYAACLLILCCDSSILERDCVQANIADRGTQSNGGGDSISDESKSATSNEGKAFHGP